MKLKSLLFALGIGLSTFAQKTYQYAYDDMGNRITREVIYLTPIAPGGGTGFDSEVDNSQDPSATKKSIILETASQSFSLYPNPTSSSVNVAFVSGETNTDEVRIIDGNGKIHYTQTDITGDFSLPFEALSPGAYFIWIRIDDDIKRVQVIKQ